MLPVHVREPSNEPARYRTAARLARSTSPPGFDPAVLAGDRQDAARENEAYAARFARVVAAHGVGVSRVRDARAAADRIAALAAGTTVAVSRAAAVGELYPALVQRGIEPLQTYGPRGAEFEARRQHFWEVAAHEPSVSWQTHPLEEWRGRRRDVVGLLGVNAAAAASGTVYLLQHSSNIGDLLRAARTLVFVVGIDKIVRDDDAARRQVEAAGTYGLDAVLLDLGRAAPMSIDPLEHFPQHGSIPPTVEVILLDNGRTALRTSRYRSLFTCIGCRACATRCPTYPAFRGPRGWNPKDYLWSHLRGDNPSLELCTLCGNCEVDCPLDIPLPTLIACRRADHIGSRGRGRSGWQRRVHGEVELIGKVFAATAPASNAVTRLPLAATVMGRVFGLAPERRLPAFHRDTFERWYTERRRLVAGAARPGSQDLGSAAGGRPQDSAGVRSSGVVYYFGCFANYNDPAVGRATVSVLETLGYDVVLPEWRCCGIPLYAKGEVGAARAMVAANLAALRPHLDAGREIVTSCPSCQLALARDYPRLYPSAAAERVARHTHFLSRFLLAAGGIAPRVAPLPQRAAYHLPCHLRALGMDEDSARLLGEIPGLKVTSINRGCCGLSGTFGLERAHYRGSMEVGAGLFAAVTDGDFDLVLTDCGACKLQLQHGTGRGVTHPLEIVSRALERGRAAAPSPLAAGASR